MSFWCHVNVDFPKIRGTLVRVPRMRTRVYWDPLILGNYRVGFYDCIYTRGSIITYHRHGKACMELPGGQSRMSKL